MCIHGHSSSLQEFVWGTATAAYQIEGATVKDGKGSLDLGQVLPPRRGGSWTAREGDVGCDHYHRYREDFALMKRAGAAALPLLHRLAAHCPRRARAPSTRSGLDFYDRLVDSMLERGIRPFATLFHWDLPAGPAGCRRVDEQGNYHRVRPLRGDRRRGSSATGRSDWMTHNEPWVVAYVGHLFGRPCPRAEGLDDRALPWPTASCFLTARRFP